MEQGARIPELRRPIVMEVDKASNESPHFVPTITPGESLSQKQRKPNHSRRV